MVGVKSKEPSGSHFSMKSPYKGNINPFSALYNKLGRSSKLPQLDLTHGPNTKTENSNTNTLRRWTDYLLQSWKRA